MANEITSHPLFGYTAVDNFQTGVVTLTGKGANGAETTADIRGYAFRESGIEKKIKENIQIGKALADPSAYMTEKNADLARIGNELTDLFKLEYERLLRAGSSDVEAKKKATQWMEQIKVKKMEIHHEQFPTKVAEEVLKKMKNEKF